jgi:hypothetical protein
VLELGRRVGEHLHCFLQHRHAVVAALDQTARPEGGAERTGSAPHSGELDLLVDETARFLPLVQREERERRLRAPRHERRVAPANRREAAAGVERALQPAPQVAPQ